jgi:hypothetical protein
MESKRLTFVIALLGVATSTASAFAGIVPTPGPDGIVHLSRPAPHVEGPPGSAAAAAEPSERSAAPTQEAPVAAATTPMPISEPATPVVPSRVPRAVPSYSASSITTGPAGNAVGNGSMSAGIGARGALLAESARAGAGSDRGSYCRRDGRSKAMVDACLKTVAGR